MELNIGGIIASSKVNTKAQLEPACDTQTQVDIIQSWIHVKFVRPPTSLPFKSCNTHYR